MLSHDCARAYRANTVLTASPGQLVLLMYDGALKALAVAREACGRPEAEYQRIAVINSQLIKAQQIIAELRNTLNMEAGGDFAQTLDRLYDYYNRRLLEANLQKKVEPIIEVERLLGELRSAWAEMLRNQDNPQSPNRLGGGARHVA